MTRFDPAGPLKGSLRPPPDKSISHRAALFAAMADDHTLVENYLAAADTRSTLYAIEAVGAKVNVTQTSEGRQSVEIHGVGMRGAKPAQIDVGNAGTLLRMNSATGAVTGTLPTGLGAWNVVRSRG